MRTHTFAVAISLAAAVFYLALISQATYANAFLFVDRLDDVATATACTDAADDCSLRGAILAANDRTDETTVIVPTGQYALSLAGDDKDGLAGDINITAEFVEIRGSGRGETTIDADLIDDGIFTVEAGATVVIKNMTLQNTKLSTVENRNGNLTVKNVTMLSGDATGGGGGALKIAGGTTRIEHTTLVKNIADSGGAILISRRSSRCDDR